MQPTMSRDLVMQALLSAVWRRRPHGTVLVHSDQGSQYGSQDYLAFMDAHSLEPSMSRRGNCLDNAVAESFSRRSRSSGFVDGFTQPATKLEPISSILLSCSTIRNGDTATSAACPPAV